MAAGRMGLWKHIRPDTRDLHNRSERSHGGWGCGGTFIFIYIYLLGSKDCRADEALEARPL